MYSEHYTSSQFVNTENDGGVGTVAPGHAIGIGWRATQGGGSSSHFGSRGPFNMTHQARRRDRSRRGAGQGWVTCTLPTALAQEHNCATILLVKFTLRWLQKGTPEFMSPSQKVNSPSHSPLSWSSKYKCFLQSH